MNIQCTLPAATPPLPLLRRVCHYCSAGSLRRTPFRPTALIHRSPLKLAIPARAYPRHTRSAAHNQVPIWNSSSRVRSSETSPAPASTPTRTCVNGKYNRFSHHIFGSLHLYVFTGGEIANMGITKSNYTTQWCISCRKAQKHHPGCIKVFRQTLPAIKIIDPISICNLLLYFFKIPSYSQTQLTPRSHPPPQNLPK